MVVREGEVLLVRQYRLLINGFSWEIPGGRVDEGETPKTAAIRECLEETGLRCTDAQPLIFYQQGLDSFSCPTHVFYSNQFEEQLELEHIDPKETSGSKWVPMSRCVDMIAAQEIVDSFTILSLLTYRTLVAAP